MHTSIGGFGARGGWGVCGAAGPSSGPPSAMTEGQQRVSYRPPEGGSSHLQQKKASWEKTAGWKKNAAGLTNKGPFPSTHPASLTTWRLTGDMWLKKRLGAGYPSEGREGREGALGLEKICILS